MTPNPAPIGLPEEKGTPRHGRFVRAGIAALAVLAGTLAMPLTRASADVTFNQRMIELVNGERVANGLAPLVVDPTLAANAEDAPYNGCGFTISGRAKDMGERNYFSHTILGCASQTVFNILSSTGLVYSGAGENVAWMNGTTDPLVAASNLHSQLMGSSGHRDNILNPNFTRVGIGSWHTNPGQTWSGGGVALANAFIGVEIFAGGAVTPTTAPPTTAPPTTVAPTTSTTQPPAVAPGGHFTPVTPARILDTRDGTGGINGAVPAGGTVDIQVTGRGGIPTTDVAAVAMNVTVTQPSTGGYLTMFPAGTARPLAAHINFGPGETVSNLVVAKVGANGKVSAFNPAGTTHVVIDVAGWYSGSSAGNAGRFQPVTPARILDTRTGTGGGVRLGPGASVDLQVTGRGGVPSSGVQAAAMNVAVTGATAASFLTVYPTGEARPWTANMAFGAGGTVASRSMVKLGAGGKVTIFNGAGSADVIVDVNGWYTDASVVGTLGNLTAVTPARILDTRDGTGGVTGAGAAGGTVDVQVAGRGGVPASGARAVILNATVTQTAGDGYLTVFPAGTARPGTSDLNFSPSDTQANLVVVELGSGGKVSLFASTGTQVVFDVAGWIS
jgi:uncharacterized protein YkwD